MKPYFSAASIAIIIFLFFGFTPKNSDQLAQKQEGKIKKEITEVFDSIIVRLERMDVEGALQYYSPNFMAFGLDGNKADFQALKKYYVDIYSSSSSYKYTSYSLNFIAITRNKVVITANGRNETILKSGRELIFDPSHYTFAFEKIDGQWKLFYHHFSGTLVK